MVGMGVGRSSHEQRGLHDAGADCVLALEVKQVRLHVECEGAQARGQKRQELVGVWQLLGERQVKQDGGGCGDEGGSGAKLRRVLAGLGEDDVHLVEQGLGLVCLTEGQVGIGADQAGGEPRGDVQRVEVGSGGREGLLGLAAEVVILGLGNVALGARSHGLDCLEVRAGGERRVHEGHERCGGKQRAGGGARRWCPACGRVVVRCHVAHALPPVLPSI